MSTLKKMTRLLSLSAAMMLSAPVYADEPINMAETRLLISQACTRLWEALASQIEYQPGDDLWQGDVSDQAQFIKYANEYLRDEQGGYLLKHYEDVTAIIYHCAGNRYNLYAGSLNTTTDDKQFYEGALNDFFDADTDGISNEFDLCANTAPGQLIDSNGCAANQRDTDNDGILDTNDQCLGTLAGSSVNGDGCAAGQLIDDYDGDGIADIDDAYPRQLAAQCAAN